MKSEFNRRGLEILGELLPNYEFEKNDDTISVKQGEKTLEFKADFEKLFKLIDDDKFNKMQDSAVFYWENLGRTIEDLMNQ
jgi:phage anti-repressor protein